jgi:hypothetical protein
MGPNAVSLGKKIFHTKLRRNRREKEKENLIICIKRQAVKEGRRISLRREENDEGENLQC